MKFYTAITMPATFLDFSIWLFIVATADKSNKTSATTGAGTAHPSGAPKFTRFVCWFFWGFFGFCFGVFVLDNL